ncbi:hypothetical protein PTKIN_Ptkin16aG0530900 [Pterospermum kingtungense]
MEMMSNGDWAEDTLIEILLKLPVKSIVRFKSVAKAWNHLFQNPNFVSQHHGVSKKKSKHLVVYNMDILVSRTPKHKDISIRSFVDEALVSYHDLGQQLPPHFAAMNDYFDICIDNGLFCLFDSHNSVLALWNPATREFRNLPECNLSFSRKTCSYLTPNLGFGLDPCSNDYKVIYMRHYVDFDKNLTGRHYAIYKMSTDSWRVLKEEEVPFSLDLVIRGDISKACVNGVYYWFANWQSKVLAFHLGSEAFELIESPLSEQNGSGELLILHDRISVWDAQFGIDRKRSNEVWMLNNEGQWTKVLKIELPVLQAKWMFGFWKVYSKVLVESVWGELLVYDLESHEFKKLGIQTKNPGYIFQVFTYEESLFSINNKVSRPMSKP